MAFILIHTNAMKNKDIKKMRQKASMAKSPYKWIRAKVEKALKKEIRIRIIR